MNFDEMQVLVFGTGKSGIGAVHLLEKLGCRPILFDGNEKADADIIRSRIGENCDLEIYTGKLDPEVIDRLDLAVLSPGVPVDTPQVEELKAHGVRIWGEVELAYRAGKGEVCAITGTNGKTTTTALTGKILSDAFPSVFVVGNIGTAYTSRALEMTDESKTAAEISSFQLETIEEFRPKVSAILNITEDHLNRHHTMEEYIRVKERIAENQTEEDTCVLNYEDPVLRSFGEGLKTKVIWFSSRRELPEGFFLRGDEIVCRMEGQETVLVNTGDLQILGEHNYENVMAASAITMAMGVSLEDIRRSVCEFKAVEHRIEFVTEKEGVAYYNDSKGTNPDAAIKGIRAMNRPTLLIAGGYDKGSSYDEWIEAFDGKVRYLVLIGQTREKIQAAAQRCGLADESIILCDDLKEAVQICHDKALPGDCVLLSPACASWGQFENYEQRGDLFKEYVRNL